MRASKLTLSGALPSSTVDRRTTVILSILGSEDGDAVAVFSSVGGKVGVGGVMGISVLVTTRMIGVAVRYSVAVADSIGDAKIVGVAVGVGSARFTSNGELNNEATVVPATPIRATTIAVSSLRFLDFAADFCVFFVGFPLPALAVLPSFFGSVRLSEVFLGG